jgi:L-threonylcarbamoyladenylate synthase
LSPEILKISSEAPESHVIDYAASFIRRGRVIAIPTDTFYGLCADPFNLYARKPARCQSWSTPSSKQ